MYGEGVTEASLTYKNTVLPKTKIADKEECSMLLLQSEEVPVISVVSSFAQKEIPFPK